MTVFWGYYRDITKGTMPWVGAWFVDGPGNSCRELDEDEVTRHEASRLIEKELAIQGKMLK